MVDFSEKVKDSVDEIRFFLKTKMYNNNAVLKKNDNGKLIIKKPVSYTHLTLPTKRIV